MPEFKDMQHLSFREELHAIEAVIAGQGVGIFSDVARGARTRRRHAREGVRSELAGISLLRGPQARSSAREDHPGLLDVAAVRYLRRIVVCVCLRVPQVGEPLVADIVG